MLVKLPPLGHHPEPDHDRGQPGKHPLTPESPDIEPVSSTASGPGSRTSIVEDLEQRIDELEHLPEERFGTFTTLDWFLGAAGALLLPYILYLWYWP